MRIPPNLHGIIAMVAAMGVFIAADSCIKLALPFMPLFELSLMRGVASVLFCLVLLKVTGQLQHLRLMFNPWVTARAVLETSGNIAFTIAILKLPLADVVAIAQICPMLVLLGAWLIWGEKLGTSRLFLIALGITGALLVAQPGSSAASPMALLGFFVAGVAASRDLMTRKVPTNIPAPVVAFTVLVTLMLSSLIGMLLFETPVVPQWRSVGLAVLAGALIVGGHIGVFIAYKIGPARSVAPFMYTLTLWAVFFGVVLFGDIPNTLAIAGMALILLAGLAIIVLDTRRRPVAA